MLVFYDFTSGFIPICIDDVCCVCDIWLTCNEILPDLCDLVKVKYVALYPLNTLPPSFFSRLSLMVILVMFINGMIGSFGFRKLESSLSLTKSLS